MRSKIKTVLITGATGGIGRSIVQNFINNKNYRIIALNSGKKKISIIGTNVENFSCDFNSHNADKKLTNFINQIDCIDILINNAGFVTDTKSILEIDNEKLYSSINLNFTMALTLIKLSLPKMILNNYGRIINISSNTVALKGSQNNFSYFISKGMIDNLTIYVSKHFSNYNITCNAIRPGLINSGMNNNIDGYNIETYEARIKKIPGGNPGKVEDISSMVKYLSLETSWYISGQIISISKSE